jgi:hypothetical protein
VNDMITKKTQSTGNPQQAAAELKQLLKVGTRWLDNYSIRYIDAFSHMEYFSFPDATRAVAASRLGSHPQLPYSGPEAVCA